MAPDDLASQRMVMALDLYDASEAIVRQSWRRKLPQADDGEIERRVSEWLLSRPGAPLGDTPGRPRAWPRRAT